MRQGRQTSKRGTEHEGGGGQKSTRMNIHTRLRVYGDMIQHMFFLSLSLTPVLRGGL